MPPLALARSSRATCRALCSARVAHEPALATPTPSSSGPLFAVPAASVRPLSAPADFFAALLASVRASSQRVSLASLYIGAAGAREQQLVRELRLQCARRPRLRVAVQLDLGRALRRTGTAPAFASSAHHLLELFRPPDAADWVLSAADEGTPSDGPGSGGAPLSERVRVGLTLLPQQRAWPATAVPPRFVETAGVFHLKAYVFDRHTVILSGANLSEDYFTSRQDRYVLVGGGPGVAAAAGFAGVEAADVRAGSCGLAAGGVGALANYLHGLVDDLATLPGSHELLASGEVVHVSVARRPRPPPAPLQMSWRPQRASASSVPEQAPPRGQPVIPAFDVAKTPPALHAAFALELRRLLDARSFQGVALESVSRTGFSGDAAVSSVCLIAPRLQLGVLGVRHDEVATLQLLRGLRAWPLDECHVATGYFNLTRACIDAIIGPLSPPLGPRSGRGLGLDLSLGPGPEPAGAPAGSAVRLLTAAPEANGFFGARGISGAVPAAYGELARRFHAACLRAGRVSAPAGPDGAGAGMGVSLHEYAREGWTFHAKGLWLASQPTASSSAGAFVGTCAGTGACVGTGEGAGAGAGAGKNAGESNDARPRMVSLVGSPNFGRRSTERDLELQFCFATRDAALVSRFVRERDALWSAAHAAEVGLRVRGGDVWARPGRRLEGMGLRHGLWVHAFLRVFGGHF